MTEQAESAKQPGAEASACPGCGLVLPTTTGPTHPYIGSSASCWALFGELLAREFNNAAYFDVHQLTVDSYAVQHPGVPERRSIQSVALSVADVLKAGSAQEHHQLVRAWAGDVWEAWGRHHSVVRGWVEQRLG